MFIALGIYSREGGMERFSRRITTCLAEMGRSRAVEGPVVVALWDGPEDLKEPPPEVSFHAGRCSKIGTAGLFTRLVITIRPDVVMYGHLLLVPLAAVVRLLRPGARQILFVHGTEVWDRAGWVVRLIVRRWVDTVVSVSDFTAARMGRAFLVPRAKFRVLPNAVDCDGVGDAPRIAPAGPFRLVTVTRLERRDTYKNVDKILRALPGVLAEFPETEYYVVGEGDARPVLEELARSLAVAKSVHFLGRLEDPDRDLLMRRCHLFVLPSTGEGFGIVFLEAWLQGLPVICSNRDAASEVVQHGLTGLCVDPEPEAIGSAVRDLLRHPERMRRMGEAGLRRVRERYSHPSFFRGFSEILEESRATSGRQGRPDHASDRSTIHLSR